MEQSERIPRIIAFYLPQFHPIPENDAWWGKGFTEWTNVGKAKPLFRGHYQPHIPSELGYYDLRVPETREHQAQLAKNAGIEGFCYWHYWFGKGRQLLEVLNSGTPDFPFCLAWANHSWYAKTWDKMGGDRLLISQEYDDVNEHFQYVLKAFKDSRYIKVDGKPLFLVFDPNSLPKNYIEIWNRCSIENGLDGICFVARIKSYQDIVHLKEKGFSYFTMERIAAISHSQTKLKMRIQQLSNLLRGYPANCYSYAKAMKYFIDVDQDSNEVNFPMIIPQWDHSPRSGKRGFILRNSTPHLFKKHLHEVFKVISSKNNKIVFLKSWNEWAEGNYIEPDIKWGNQYLNTLKETIEEYKNSNC